MTANRSQNDIKHLHRDAIEDFDLRIYTLEALRRSILSQRIVQRIGIVVRIHTAAREIIVKNPPVSSPQMKWLEGFFHDMPLLTILTTWPHEYIPEGDSELLEKYASRLQEIFYSDSVDKQFVALAGGEWNWTYSVSDILKRFESQVPRP